MNDVNLIESLGQVPASETGRVFRDFLRGHVREMICEVMASEVTELCGFKHAPSSSDHYRAGSSSGRVLLEGEREDIDRPRMRHKTSSGTSKEVELASYKAAKDPQQLQAQIVQAIGSSVSSRAIEEIKPNSPGVRASEFTAAQSVPVSGNLSQNRHPPTTTSAETKPQESPLRSKISNQKARSTFLTSRGDNGG